MTAQEAEPVTAGGGVLFRETGSGMEVLLIYRRGVWDLPKGKLDPGETVEECARREVAEEVGTARPQLLEKLQETYHEYRQGGTRFGKTTHWYAMALAEGTGSDLQPQRSEGIEGLEWVYPDEALRRVGYENLKEVLRSFLRWYRSRSGTS